MVLDTRRVPEPKHLLFDLGHFAVVNKKSTSGYLETLDEMNRSVGYRFVTPENAETVIHNRQPIMKSFFDKEEGIVAVV